MLSKYPSDIVLSVFTIIFIYYIIYYILIILIKKMYNKGEIFKYYIGVTMERIVGTYIINDELITLENIDQHYEYIHVMPRGIEYYDELMDGYCFDVAESMLKFYPEGEMLDVFIIGTPFTNPEKDIETLIPHGVVRVGDCIIDPITAASPHCKDFMQAAEYLIPIRKEEGIHVPTERMKITKHKLRSKFKEKYWLCN